MNNTLKTVTNCFISILSRGETICDVLMMTVTLLNIRCNFSTIYAKVVLQKLQKKYF